MKRRKPRTEAPEDLSAEQWNALSRWVAQKHEWVGADLEVLVENCLNHHRALGNEMADWVAACRTWIGNEKLWRRRSGTPGSTPGRRQGYGLANAARIAARDLGLFGDN